jgi:hypothetical protein
MITVTVVNDCLIEGKRVEAGASFQITPEQEAEYRAAGSNLIVTEDEPEATQANPAQE